MIFDLLVTVNTYSPLFDETVVKPANLSIDCSSDIAANIFCSLE